MVKNNTAIKGMTYVNFFIALIFLVSYGTVYAVEPPHPPHPPFELNKQAVEPLGKDVEHSHHLNDAGKRLQAPAPASSLEAIQPPKYGEQTIVIDIPGIETQGANRPTQWGRVLLVSPDFARHNIRHKGALRFNLQSPEPGVTTTLPRPWADEQAPYLLAPVLADLKAGRDTYIKIDQNMKLPSYIVGGKPREGQWVRSVADWFAAEVRQINPNARLILNTHSKGTLDAQGIDLLPFNNVLFSSHRGSVSDVQRLVGRYPTTHFTLISGDRDFVHGPKGFMKLNASNLTVINLKSGGLLPTTVHGQVTDPTYRGILDVKTLRGVQRSDAALGDIVLKDLRKGPGTATIDPVKGLSLDPNTFRLNSEAIGLTGNQLDSLRRGLTESWRRGLTSGSIGLGTGRPFDDIRRSLSGSGQGVGFDNSSFRRNSEAFGRGRGLSIGPASGGFGDRW